jgi:release factor glutamine methyltransferase
MFATMTLAEARTYATQQLLSAADPGEAQAMAIELVLHVAEIEKKDWAQQLNNPFSEENSSKLTQLIQRVASGEPLQYVTGEAWFFGLKLHVSPAVLIPRPETEELVDWFISHCQFPIVELPILEIGAGSGCIAVALQKRLRKATVTAIEYSVEALEVAKKNAKNLGYHPRFIKGDLFDQTQWEEWPNFSMLISNPPYIPFLEKDSMEKRVKDYEPSLALFVPDEDPLKFYRYLGKLLLEKGTPNAQLFCELNARLAQETAELFQSMGLQTTIKLDMQGKERMLRVWR